MPVELQQLKALEKNHHDIKLVFFDVDGTLIDANGEYSKQTQSEIIRIQRQGIQTAIASGRPNFATRFLWEELSLNRLGLFCSGAMIYDPLNGSIVKEHIIPPETVMDFYRRVRQTNLYCELYCHSHYYVEPAPDPEFKEIIAAHSKALRVSPKNQHFVEVIDSEPVIKLLVGARNEEEVETVKHLESSYSHLRFAFAHMVSHPNWTFASVLSGNVDKCEEFHFLCERYGLEALQVMAIGDAHSDLDFLRLAGTGVAMGNANAEVQAAADYVTTPVWSNGVAHALQKLIP